MTQLFRYLVLIYLAGSVLLIAALFSWQHYHAEKRTQWHLQQYADLLKVSLRPYLSQSSAEQLNSHLTELQYSALLPVAALAIYQPNGEQLAGVGTINLLPSHLPQILQRQYQLQDTGTLVFAVQPLYTLYTPADHFGAYQVPDAYLIVVPELTNAWHPIWLPLSLALGIYSVVFLLTLMRLRRWQQQRAEWLSLLINRDEGATAATADLPEQSALPAEFSTLQQMLTPSVQQQQAQLAQNQQLQQQLLLLQQNLIKQSDAQLQSERLSSITQQQISAWLHQYQLLWQRQEQLSAPVFQTLLRLHFLYGLLQFTPPAINETAFSLVSWLAQQLPQLNNLVPHDLSIDWLEGAENANFVVMQDEKVLLALLQALLLLALRSDNANSIVLRLRVENSISPQLQIHLSCDGSGLPSHLTSQLQQGKSAQWQWRDADIAVLQLYTQILSAELKVQSLEGLGSSIRLNIPVELQATRFSPRIGNLLVFDFDTERLDERVATLSGQAIQVSGTSRFEQLQQKLSEFMPDMLLLFLPAQLPDQDWLALLNRYQQQLCIQVFVPTLNLTSWQAVTPCKSAAEFCLQLLHSAVLPVKPTNSFKNLLVVDDNETNQAFIRVLLQQKSVHLHAAFTGNEVLQLCQQQQFDMILLDIRLPDLSGTEVARQLRQLPSYRHTPILAFTAHALPAEIAEFKEAGMDDILLKPLDPCKFETLLARYQLY